MHFSDLGLEPNILQALADAGYSTPTPIQEKAIPEALAGHDVLGIAQTGTGKTASFTLPMIQRLARGRARARMPRSLVLCPTRELAAQVAENFEKYGKHYKLTMALLIGGVSFDDQESKLLRGVDVLIATPGRLLDHFGRGRLLLTGIEVMVVDEADRMLDMGFIPDIEKIFRLVPPARQTLFFSATMPSEIQRLTDQFLKSPARIEVSRPATAATTIRQRILRTPIDSDKAKRHALRRLMSLDDVKNGIVFCNRKTTVDLVAKSLQKHGFDARPIHGDLPQSYRTETLDKFRSGELRFLIASDVAARGLDIPAVSHVFNYDVPMNSDDYVHRIGRTGRAGRQGDALSIVTPKDGKFYDAILRTVGEIEEVDLGAEFQEELANAGARDEGRGERGRRDRRHERARGAAGDRGKRDRRPPPRHDAPQASTEPHRATATPQPSAREEPRPARRRRPDGETNEAVVGFGVDLPAFMSR